MESQKIEKCRRKADKIMENVYKNLEYSCRVKNYHKDSDED